MDIQQHMKLSRQQRQRHIDLTTPCYGHVIQKGKNKGQLSDSTGYSKQSLLDFHQIEEFKISKIHTCHLCYNDSRAPNGFICINPQHLYFGSVSENQMDRPEDSRKEAASKAGKLGGKIGGKAPASDKQKKSAAKAAKKLLKEGIHVSQQLHTCPVCGFEGKGGVMKRWHYDNCKHKKI